MMRPHPRSTLADTLFPYTTLFLSLSLCLRAPLWGQPHCVVLPLGRDMARNTICVGVYRQFVRQSRKTADLNDADERSFPRGRAVLARPQFNGRSRSEERRVGKERVSTCRSRWSPSH